MVDMNEHKGTTEKKIKYQLTFVVSEEAYNIAGKFRADKVRLNKWLDAELKEQYAKKIAGNM